MFSRTRVQFLFFTNLLFALSLFVFSPIFVPCRSTLLFVVRTLLIYGLKNGGEEISILHAILFFTEPLYLSAHHDASYLHEPLLPISC